MTQFTRFITEGLIKLPEKTKTLIVDQYLYWMLAYSAKVALKDADEVDQMMVASVVKRLAGSLGIRVPTSADIDRATKTISTKIKMDDLPEDYLRRLKSSKNEVKEKILTFKLLFTKDRYLGKDIGYAERVSDDEAIIVISALNILGDTTEDLLISPSTVMHNIKMGISTIEHELTHVIQYLVLGVLNKKQIDDPKAIKVAKSSAITKDDNYYLSQIEFDPMIKSAIAEIKAKLDLFKNADEQQKREIVDTYVWGNVPSSVIKKQINNNTKKNSKFFAVLKLHDPNKWKKAVKLLYSKI